MNVGVMGVARERRDRRGDEEMVGKRGGSGMESVPVSATFSTFLVVDE